MSLKETEAFANGMYAGVQLVTEYMQKCSGMIEGVFPRPATGHRDAALQLLFYRAYAWMKSLEKLNHAKHFQPISVGVRALLEILVDVLLLHHDRSNHSGWKIYWWGQSERMRAAEILVRFYQDQGLPIPDEHSPMETTFNQDKASIDHIRKQLWPHPKTPDKPRHPDRWTGRPSLFEDVGEADKLFASEIKEDLGVSLVEFYRTEYRKINWHIHSGTAGTSSMPPEALNIVSGLSYRWCADLAMLCTKMVLIDFGFTTAIDDLKAEWEELLAERNMTYLRLLNAPGI